MSNWTREMDKLIHTPNKRKCITQFEKRQDHPDSAFSNTPVEKPMVFQLSDINSFPDKLLNEQRSKIQSDTLQHEGYECYLCSSSLPSSGSLRHHLVRSHQVHPSFSYFCVLCDYEYWNENQRNHHQWNRHGIKNTDSLCNICGLQLSSRAECRAHQRKHPPKLACSACPKKFASNHQLASHVQNHISTLKPHVCYICGNRFQNSKAWIIHNWRHELQKCPKCFLEFEDESLLLAHLHQTHHVCGQKFESFISERDKGDNEFDLLICQFEDYSHHVHQDDLTLFNDESLNTASMPIQKMMQLDDSQLRKLFMGEDEFVKIKANIQTFLRDKAANSKWIKKEKTIQSFESSFSRNHQRCTFCNSSFQFTGDHFSRPSEHKEIYTCHICSQMFASLKLLRRHITIHRASSDSNQDPNKAIICPECGKLFATLSSLSRHQILSHNHPIGKFKCKKCGKSLRTKSHLNAHLYKFHKICYTIKNYQCKICDKAFTSEKFLSLHEQIHEDKRKVGNSSSLHCDKCGKIFIRKSNYLKHMDNHKSSHSCSYCSSEFDSLSKLSSHLVTHSKEMKERFSCFKCSLRFCYKSQLKIHLRTHTNERPFVCEVCGKGFKRLQQCKVHHSLVHSSEKLQCPECDKKFGTEANLLRHRLVLHCNLRRWICGVCGQNYGYSQDLRCHLLKKHEVRFNTLENGQKKSRFEVYIIPELGCHDLSDTIKCRIKAVYSEEKAKLDVLRSKLSSHTSDQIRIALIKPAITLEPINKAIIDTINGEEEVMSCSTQELITANVPEHQNCLYCNTKLLVAKNYTNLCSICNGVVCSSAHLNIHLFQKHAMKFQCYVCSSLFNSTDLCLDHIKKVHCGTIDDVPVEHFANIQAIPQKHSPSIEGMNVSLPLVCNVKQFAPVQIVPQQIAYQVFNVPQTVALEHSSIVEDISKLISKENFQTGIVVQPATEAIIHATPLNQVFLAPADASDSLSIGSSLGPDKCHIISAQTFYPQTNVSTNIHVGDEIEANSMGDVGDGSGLISSEALAPIPPIVSLKRIKANSQDLQSETQGVTTSSFSAASLLLTLSRSNDANVCDAPTLGRHSPEDMRSGTPLKGGLEDCSQKLPSAGVHTYQSQTNSELFKGDDQNTLGSFCFNEGITVVSELRKPIECTRIDLASASCTSADMPGTDIFLSPSSNETSTRLLEENAELTFQENSSGRAILHETKMNDQLTILNTKDTDNWSDATNLQGQCSVGVTPSELSCSICQKSFASPTKLKRHMRIHQKGKYSCHICDKTFVENFNLKTHLLIHTNAKSLQCDTCNKSFRYYRDLKDHLNSHLEVCPYSCSACDLSFLRQKDLARHTKEQHIKCEYKCVICEKVFKRKSYLEKVHMPSHTKTKSNNAKMECRLPSSPD